MSKKRKTRKEKEIATRRNADHITHQVSSTIPTYSIKNIDIKKPISTISNERIILTDEMSEQKDIAYLKHDMVAISAASGIIIGFDILLLVLLTTGGLRLGFLGY